MSTTETWTVLRLLEWTEAYLRDHGSESPRLDAEVLLANARECQRIDLYTAYSEIASDALRATFRELVQRRAQGTPVAYLVGHREFFSRSFRVTPDVLIPRPETEFVIIELLDRVPRRDAAVSIADVGTGSGILAVTAAAELPGASVWATDIQPAALEIAAENAAQHGVADRVQRAQGDLLESINTTFDFILSNLPYVSQSEYEQLSPEVKDHEPKIALVGGPGGSEIISRLIPQAAERLKQGGWLMMEISPMLAERVTGMVEQHGAFSSVSVRKDLSQLPRVVVAQRQG